MSNLNWKNGQIQHPYNIGDLVWTHYEGHPEYQYRVLQRREGPFGWEVKVASVDFQETVVVGVWLAEHFFFPISVSNKNEDIRKMYPHDCRYCGAPAFEYANKNDCSAECNALKPQFRKKP